MSGSISGSTVPLGLAADVFYAKGDSSVATLLQQVAELPGMRGIEIAARLGLDVWVPALPAATSSFLTLAVSLPPLLAGRLLHAEDE